MLKHRKDQEAFYAYMDRRDARSHQEAIAPDDPEWEAKVMAKLRAQMGET